MVVGFKSGVKIANFIYVSGLNYTSNKLGAVAKNDITSFSFAVNVVDML
jgi:hypothetical protein